MRTCLLYFAAAAVGLYFSASLAMAGLDGAPSSFAWWSTVLFIGSALLAGSAALRLWWKRPCPRWSAVLGSGILTTYFIPSAISTLRDYERGEAIASPAQLGIRLALGVPVLASMAIALWSIWDYERLTRWRR
jgi:hypothetical protein